MTWAQVLAKVVEQIPWRAYGYGGTGVSRELRWQGKRILSADAASYCSGATFEALVLALSAAGMEPLITVAEIHELRKWTYILDAEAHPERAAGVAGGLADLGWADEVDVEDAQAGDLVQIQWQPDVNPLSGHAVVAIDSLGTLNGAPVLWAWSSNTSTPKVAFSPSAASPFKPTPLKSGIQADYFKTKKGTRAFNVARLSPDFLAQGGVVVA